MTLMIWIGIFLCLTQSALFSGLTIGLFGLSRLRLEVQAETGDKNALKILSIRKDANRLLATLLWGNVSVNVLLTLLTDSVLSGVAAFISSTFLITIFGEIMPQAFLARYASRVGAWLVPFVQLYQLVLYPFAKPTSFLLDLWLGKESIAYFGEDEFKIMLKKHAQSSTSDIGNLEALGAINFLALDDISIEQEGEVLDPASIVSVPFEHERLVFPKFKMHPHDSFVKKIQASGKKWVVLTDSLNQPVLVLNANPFLRDVLLSEKDFNPFSYCHRPILVTKPGTKLGSVIRRLKVRPQRSDDDVIHEDLILYWGAEKRIITGADILGRLLRGIVDVQSSPKP